MTALPLDFPPLAERAAVVESDFLAAVLAVRSGETPSAAAYLLSDLTRPESQAVWLRWLAEKVGVRNPPVGTPRWGWYRPARGFVCFELSDIDDEYEIVFGFGFGPEAMGGVGYYCPAIPDPNSPDAPIRALALAILTVGGRTP